MFGNTDDYQRKGMNQQHQEPGEQKDMKDPGNKVSRLLPLDEPEFQDFSQPKPRPVKTKVALASQQRQQALRDKVGKTCDAERIDDQKQASTRRQRKG
jgi:hypothetical protein